MGTFMSMSLKCKQKIITYFQLFTGAIHAGLYQLVMVHGVNDVRQTETQTVQPLMPKPIAFEIEMAVGKLKRCKALSIDQTPAEQKMIRQKRDEVTGFWRRVHNEELHDLYSLLNIIRVPDQGT